jgi:hypothetical protein
MRAAYKGIAHAIAACVVLQATWIALAWFSVLKDVDDGKTFTKDSDANVGHMLHSIFGTGVMPLLGLALLVVAFFVKAPGAVKWAAFVLLAIAVQIALAFIAFGVPAIGALHGINAFVVAGLAETAARRVDSAEALGAGRAETATV